MPPCVVSLLLTVTNFVMQPYVMLCHQCASEDHDASGESSCSTIEWYDGCRLGNGMKRCLRLAEDLRLPRMDVGVKVRDTGGGGGGAASDNEPGFPILARGAMRVASIA
mmetsp:Transcript_16309/g.45213  ORF Transcript_16309/g.45213 Transcript_16309/m.45213 type:complete len:109 (-) Transcript_16309:465-791(-)